MTDPTIATPTPQAEADDAFTLPILIYALYLLGLFMGMVPSIIGVVIAHIKQGESMGAVRSHYSFQIRTFWISIAIGFGGLALTALMFGGTLIKAFTIANADGVGETVASALAVGGLVGAVIWMGMLAVFVFFFLLIRSIYGLIRAAQRQAIGIPQ